MWVISWMESAVLVLDGLCSAHGTWNADVAVLVLLLSEEKWAEMPAEETLCWVGVWLLLRVEVAVGDILPGGEQVSCLSSLCCLLFLSWKVRERKAALIKCRAGSPAKGLSQIRAGFLLDRQNGLVRLAQTGLLCPSHWGCVTGGFEQEQQAGMWWTQDRGMCQREEWPVLTSYCEQGCSTHQMWVRTAFHARPGQAEGAAWVCLLPREAQEGSDSQVRSHVSYQQPREGE